MRLTHNQAAEELIALGCAAGAMHIHDGVARLGFLGEVSAFVDEVIEDVKEGVISAAEGVAVFWGEQQELRDKVTFYLRNGVGLVAGVVQVASKPLSGVQPVRLRQLLLVASRRPRLHVPKSRR